jgi:hypothetical protein
MPPAIGFGAGELLSHASATSYFLRPFSCPVLFLLAPREAGYCIQSAAVLLGFPLGSGPMGYATGAERLSANAGFSEIRRGLIRLDNSLLTTRGRDSE